MYFEEYLITLFIFSLKEDEKSLTMNGRTNYYVDQEIFYIYGN